MKNSVRLITGIVAGNLNAKRNTKDVNTFSPRRFGSLFVTIYSHLPLSISTLHSIIALSYHRITHHTVLLVDLPIDKFKV